jgi:hypothetical protein
MDIDIEVRAERVLQSKHKDSGKERQLEGAQEQEKRKSRSKTKEEQHTRLREPE